MPNIPTYRTEGKKQQQPEYRHNLKHRVNQGRLKTVSDGLKTNTMEY
ncbi:hypothetical protein [Neisseria sp.]|nr:hypothetical protein [Neisseria sp.]MDO4907512.1 hypothetical protein [Neisseria sp.]